MPDYTELIKEAQTLQHEDSQTWWDADPEVAWDVPESYHGKAKQIALDAGWEPCYHDRHTILHFNVKAGGNYRDLQEAISNIDRPLIDTDRLDKLINLAHDMEMEWWWEARADFIYEATDYTNVTSWSCGRSGGYFNVQAIATDAEAMVKIAKSLREAVDYYNGSDYADYLVEEAMSRYDEEQFDALASPRERMTW